MPLSTDQHELFARIRTENLSTEIKEKLDISTHEGRAKLVKGCQALYNRNGGLFLIGFDDSGNPKPLDQEIISQFNADSVQEIISRHSVPTFEVEVDFLEIDGAKFPVLLIPSGVRIPVSVRKEIKSPDAKVHLPFEDVYFRSLAANGRASSAKLRPADFASLFEICFANRETDIASFLRRHLSDLTARLSEGAATEKSTNEMLSEELKYFDTLVAREVASLGEPTLEPWLLNALTLKVAVVCDPPLPSDGIPTQTFLSRVFSSNPNLTGWPIWMDTRNLRDRRIAPHVMDGGFISTIPFGAFERPGLAVHRFTPDGKLYLRRVLQDDTSDKVERGKYLDPFLLIYRVAEVVIVALSILKGIGAGEKDTAHFRFELTGLKKRTVGSWANLDRHFSGGTAFEDQASSFVSIPTAQTPRQVSSYVSQIVRPLLAVFDGAEISESLVEELLVRLIERRF